MQNKGCRVEVLAFKNVAKELKREADLYISGYLIPHLLPFDYDQESNSTPKWGVLGGKARGICYAFNVEKGFGFIRYLTSLKNGNLWITDSRRDDSPYQSVFVHKTNLPADFDMHKLPHRELVFEFNLAKGLGVNELQAIDIKLIK